RQLWSSAAAEPEAPDAQVGLENIVALVSVVYDALSARSIPSFQLAEWLPLRTWADALMDARSPIFDASRHDIRHALNAAWLARIDADRSYDKDLTAPALELVKDICQASRLSPAGGMRGA